MRARRPPSAVIARESYRIPVNNNNKNSSLPKALRGEYIYRVLG